MSRSALGLTITAHLGMVLRNSTHTYVQSKYPMGGPTIINPEIELDPCVDELKKECLRSSCTAANVAKII
jgi:hypothetical protein